MKTVGITPKEEFVIQENNGLNLYLHSLLNGREATPHSWLYETEPSDVTLARWRAILSRGIEPLGYRDLINQFELEQLKKFGPQGKVPPVSEGLDTLADSYNPSPYDNPEAADFREGNSHDEKDAYELAKLFLGDSKPMTLRPLPYTDVVDDMRERDTLETNSGWPLFSRRNKPEIIRRSIQDAKTGKAYEYPAILLFRSYNGKLRPVWMYPMSMNLVEGAFTQTIQDHIRQGFQKNPNSILGNYVAPWAGFEDVKLQFTKDWKNHNVVGGDTTKMDAHFRKAQMRTVFNILKYMFRKEYWSQLWECMKHVNDIPVLIGPHQKLVGDHGIASGSGWTQLSETVYQMWIAWRHSEVSHGMGIGDDFVWFHEDHDITAKVLVNWLDEYGLPANPSKQTVNDGYSTFLQRMFIRGVMSRDDSGVLGGIYPTIRALNSLLNPEKFHDPKKWDSDMFCVRCYMIMENTVDHPLFEQFCDFVVQGQKDLIPFAKASAEYLNSAQERSRLIPQLNPSYNQEKREKPLSEFSSIVYVASSH